MLNSNFLNFLIAVAAYIIPIYVANASALLFGKGTPLDFNKKLFNKPLFGKGKTFRGTFAGVACGIISVFLLDFFIPDWFVSDYKVFGILLVIGAIAGDIFASFWKRRFGLEPGHPVLLLDQLDFVAGSIAFTAPLRIPNIWELLFIVVFTFFMHKLTNYIAYKIKIKAVAW